MNSFLDEVLTVNLYLPWITEIRKIMKGKLCATDQILYSSNYWQIRMLDTFYKDLFQEFFLPGFEEQFEKFYHK